MPVVKSGQSASLLRTAVVLDVQDMERHARRMIADAQAQADAIVAEARHRAAHMAGDADHKGHEEGFQRGVREGREQGLREGADQALVEWRERLDVLSQKWTQAFEEWEAQREHMFDAAREDVLTFAFALAERVVHRLVRADPAIVAEQLKHALERLGRPSMLQVSIHPEDRPVIERVLPEITAALGGATHIRVHDDATIDRGGCAVSTVGGYVDASLGTQLDRLAEALLRNGRLIERPPVDGASR